MHYGSLQGEVAAAGHIGSATGAGAGVASLVGKQFNIASASLVSPGTFFVKLHTGVPVTKSSAVVTPCLQGGPIAAHSLFVPLTQDGSRLVSTTNVGSGVPILGEFYIVILRTSI